MHAGSLTKEIVDVRNQYEDISLDVIGKMKEFQKELVSNAF